jgi:hypothetical protein
MSLLLLVSGEEAEEAVVGNWTKQLNGCEHIRAVEEDYEGKMDECITKIATVC